MSALASSFSSLMRPQGSSTADAVSSWRAPLVQRKCACGTSTSSMTGECPDCGAERLQRKLRIGASNDPLEVEADQVADKVLATPTLPRARGPAAHIQRYTKSMSTQSGAAAPMSVGDALSIPGASLDAELRTDMEGRFGHDFSRVRVHTGAAAERSAREIDANAYTMGHDIVFGQQQFSPNTRSGRKLLAHELTHVVQQSGGASGPATIRAQGKKKKPATPEICGRPSKKVTGNSITKVHIDVGANTLSIDWNDKTKEPPGSAGTHDISPGSGLCCVDCNDDAVSQQSGSLCTPKGGTWTVTSTGCALAGHPSARNPTYFQRGGIAIHSGNTSSPPQSHGCARTSAEISALIHDNAVVGVTEIESSGTWAGTKCYMRESSEQLSNRKDVCDGYHLKKAKPKAQQHKGTGATPDATPDATPRTPVADVAVSGDDALTMNFAESDSGAPVDGPGPNNDPVSHEFIDMPDAEIDSDSSGGIG